MNNTGLSRARTIGGRTILEIAIFFAVLAVMAAIFLPDFARSKSLPPGQSALSRAKQLALAHLMYAVDWEDHLAMSENWMDDLGPYIIKEDKFVDPELQDRKEGQYGFAYFKPLSGREIALLPDLEGTPLVFQSVLLDRNASSDLSTLPKNPRNGRTNTIAFVDGHAKAMPTGWEPEEEILAIAVSQQP